jgi:hypothetical protein
MCECHSSPPSEPPLWPGAGHIVQPQDTPRRPKPTWPALLLVGGTVNSVLPFFDNLNYALMSLYLQAVRLRPHVAGHTAVFCNAAPGCRSVWYPPPCECGLAVVWAAGAVTRWRAPVRHGSKAIFMRYSNYLHKPNALLTVPPTGGNAGYVGHRRRGPSCGWTLSPAPGHSAVARRG